MKKILALVSFLLVAAACANQPTSNTPANSNANMTASRPSAAPSEADIIAKEKGAWDALKQKDYEGFGNMLAGDYIEVTDEGIFDKAGIVADVKDFNLADATFSDWKMLPIDNDAVIITYNTTLKAAYKGRDVPPGPYRSAGAWVNRDGKWLGIFYQQTPIKLKSAESQTASAAKPEKSAASPAAKMAEAGSDPIANEKIVWEAFKSRNYDAFAALLDPAFVEIETTAVYDKAGAVKHAAEFDASQFALSEWKPVKLDNDAALVTFLVKPNDPKADQERHTTIWANRGGKWVAILHIGSPAMKPMSNSEMKKM